MAESDIDGLTQDAILGGRLQLLQTARGHRVGHDAILLAAACPARPGERAVELGAGVGAAGLALALRVPELSVTLVEIDPELAALASRNAELNRLTARIRTAILDVAASARAFAAAGLASESAMRVLMNPPFHDSAHQRSSPDRRRRLAHSGTSDTLPTWIATAARLLQPRGTLTLIWRADGLGEVLQALGRAFGGVTLLPIHPGPHGPAVRILVRAVKASRAPLAILPGLVLDDLAGRPTPEAEAVLREGACLPLAESRTTTISRALPI